VGADRKEFDEKLQDKKEEGFEESSTLRTSRESDNKGRGKEGRKDLEFFVSVID